MRNVAKVLGGVDINASAPNYIDADPGTDFNLFEFTGLVASMGFAVRGALPVAHDCIGLIERFHFYLKPVYEKLCIVLSKLQKDQTPLMAFRAINNAPGSEAGISPTTFVSGVYRKMPG